MKADSVSRREFLRAGAVAGAAVATAPTLAQQESRPAEEAPWVLPRRKLGRTGVEVTILGQGGSFAINDRHLNIMHSMGVRYIDLAKSYLNGKSERAVGEWLTGNGRRKEHFLVTKDQPKTPGQLADAIDRRLEALQTDFIDLFFLHAVGDDDYGGAEDAKWMTDKDWAAAAERVRKSGKARFVGFSAHCNPIERRAMLLAEAAKGGWVDAIMFATDPTVMRDNKEFNDAIDACHKAGIGLISMKENRSGPPGIDKVFPKFKEKGLSPFTAVLYAMWTDERYAVVCSHMDNINKLRENATAAKDFKPLSKDDLAAVDEMIRGGERRYCVACDGTCRRAAGTQADLNTLARYVAYAEQDGRLAEARRFFAALSPKARDWVGADLHAASCACKSRVDYARVVAKATELLA